MLVYGVALSIAGFIVPPMGEIFDSVLGFATMFAGKTRNYCMLAVPEHKLHTGIIPSHMVPLFADLFSTTFVEVLPSERVVSITGCDFKISNGLCTPQQATISWGEANRSTLHEPKDLFRTFDSSFDNTFY